MARGAWMVRRRLADAELVAETVDGAGVAVMLDRPSRPLAGRVRDVTVTAHDVDPGRLAGLLRELADEMEG